MNSFPINSCLTNYDNSGLSKHIPLCRDDKGSQPLICENCLLFSNANQTSTIPESKKKFLRDMIFSTGDFDEE